MLKNIIGTAVMRQVNALPIASQSADGSSWTWKHVALGAAGVVLVGVSSYGIYSYFIKPDGTVSKGKKGRGGKSSTPKNLTEVNSDISTTKVSTYSLLEHEFFSSVCVRLQLVVRK